MSEATQNRNSAVLEAALAVAERDGWQKLTRAKVAEEAGVSDGTVSNAFGDLPNLRREVMLLAVQRESLAIICAGIAERNPVALAAPKALKAKALALALG